MASITIQADGAEERIALEAAVVTIGRGLESDIRIKDIKASRRHCQVVKTPEGFKLVDLGSGNGTFVNGIQVKEQPLKPGDKIQVGQTVIVFEIGAEEEAKPSRTGTAALPKVGPAKRAETARLQALQTKRNDAKPAAAAAVKPGTSRVPLASKPKKESTSRIEKAAGHPVEKKKTGRALARGARPAPAPAKKPNPLVFVGIAVAVLVLVAGVWFAMRGGGGESKKAAPAEKKTDRP